MIVRHVLLHLHRAISRGALRALPIHFRVNSSNINFVHRRGTLASYIIHRKFANGRPILLRRHRRTKYHKANSTRFLLSNILVSLPVPVTHRRRSSVHITTNNPLNKRQRTFTRVAISNLARHPCFGTRGALLRAPPCRIYQYRGHVPGVRTAWRGGTCRVRRLRVRRSTY